MVRLTDSFAFIMKPIPPYSFRLTIRKPAGWPLFTPFEIYAMRTIWTAIFINNILVGIKIKSVGTTKFPKIAATIFLESNLSPQEFERIKISLAHSIGADGDLTEFYEFAVNDRILRYD